jgi:hypothetical protein
MLGQGGCQSRSYSRQKRARGAENWKRIEMNQLINLVGLIVVVLAILSFFGLR